MTPAPKAWAQANELPEGWEIQLEPMWMWVKGFDEHVGNEILRIRTQDVGVDDFLLETKEFKPINLEMESNITGRAELTYRKNQWGFGVSSWFFYTDDDLTGTVVGRPTIGTDPFTTFEAGITMWSEDEFPEANPGNPPGSPPTDISWFADAELDTFTADVFVLRTLAEKPASRIDLLAGVKVGWLDMELNQGFAFREFDFAGGSTSSSQLNLTARRSDTDADFLGIGPMVGFAGDATFERVRIKAFLTQSVLAGEAEWDGRQQAIRRELETDDTSGGGPFLEDFLDTDDRTFSKEETVFIPVTEAQIKVKYEITENFALGLAGFASIWYDAPAPPEWDEDDDLWRLNERTLVFLGVGIDIEIMWP